MANIFTSLSTYHPKPPATPFEVYCLRGLTHLAETGSGVVAKLLGLGQDTIGTVQAEVAPSLYADAVFEAQTGERAILETAVEVPTSRERMKQLSTLDGAHLYVGLGELVPRDWTAVSWETIADELAASADAVEHQFSEFIRRDILGAGPADLNDATGSNRLYAMGSAVVRARFGTDATYENSAAPPIDGEFRYLGTTFAPGGGSKNCWLGIVNETVPLGGAYRLMMASKDSAISSRHQTPRATADWNWEFWTDMGPVEFEITREHMTELVGRLEWPS